MEEDEFFTVKLLFCDQDTAHEEQSQDGQTYKETSPPIEEIKSFARISRNELFAHLKSKGYKFVPKTHLEKSQETTETVSVHLGSHFSPTGDASTSSTRNTNPDCRDADEDKPEQSHEGKSAGDTHSKSSKSKKEKKRKKRKARAAEDVPAEKSQTHGGSGQAVLDIPQRESSLEQGSQHVCSEKSDETSSTCKSSKAVSSEASVSTAVEKTLPYSGRNSEGNKTVSETSSEPEKVSTTVELDVTESQAPGPICEDQKWNVSSLPDRLKIEKHFDSMPIVAKLDNLPSIGQEFDIVKILYGKMKNMDVTVLTGDAGCGKTTAAMMFVRYLDVVHSRTSFWITGENVPKDPAVIPHSANVIFIDNFLGDSRSEVYDKWKECATFISEVRHCRGSKKYQFFLITRKSQFDTLRAISSAELPVLLNSSNVVQISTDHGSMHENLKPYVDTKQINFDSFPSIGFPLCCALTPYISPESRAILFQKPRKTLHSQLSAIMNSEDISRLAYGLLALEGCIDIDVLQNDSGPSCSLDKSFLESIQSGSSARKRIDDIVSFYRESEGFVQIDDNCVSFVNASIRETVLTVMCDSHAEVMAKYCSVPLISKIALATKEFSQEDHHTEEPMLSSSTREAFLQRILQEMMSRNYHKVFQSCLFEDKSFQEDLKGKMHDEALVNQCMKNSDLNGLHFLFYAGSQDLVLKSALSVLDKTDSWKVLQALLGCCYWGRAREIPGLLEAIKHNKPLHKSLKEATIQKIVTGDLPGLAKLRDQPNWKETSIHPDDTLLTMASWRGNDAVVQELVKRGMDVNIQGQNQSTPLLHFCVRKNPDMVKFLLSKRADPNKANIQGWTPLMCGLMESKWDIPLELISETTVNGLDTGMKPLSLACGGGWDVHIIRRLLDNDDDPLYAEALEQACLYGHTHIVAFLLKKMPSNTISEMELDELLVLAISRPGRLELVTLLLKNEVVKNATDPCILLDQVCYLDSAVFKKLYVAFHSMVSLEFDVCIKAARFGDINIMKFLLGSDAPVKDAVGKDNLTCLHHACFGNAPDVVELLLKKINCNAQTSLWETPIMIALRSGRLEVAKLLLDKGASLQMKDFNRNTCLHHAVLSNSTRILKWCIVDQNMDINEANRFNVTPLHLAQARGCKRAEVYLQECGRVSGTT